jgi:hypothetical protein
MYTHYPVLASFDGRTLTILVIAVALFILLPLCYYCLVLNAATGE